LVVDDDTIPACASRRGEKVRTVRLFRQQQTKTVSAATKRSNLLNWLAVYYFILAMKGKKGASASERRIGAISLFTALTALLKFTSGSKVSDNNDDGAYWRGTAGKRQ
jgi:hypothetical protein